MYKFNLSVRAYNAARRYGLPHWEEWSSVPSETMQAACMKAADGILANKRGYRTAIELYRAAGLGIYNISLILCGEGITIERIYKICQEYDYRLHEKI